MVMSLNPWVRPRRRWAGLPGLECQHPVRVPCEFVPFAVELNVVPVPAELFAPVTGSTQLAVHPEASSDVFTVIVVWFGRYMTARLPSGVLLAAT